MVTHACSLSSGHKGAMKGANNHCVMSSACMLLSDVAFKLRHAFMAPRKPMKRALASLKLRNRFVQSSLRASKQAFKQAGVWRPSFCAGEHAQSGGGYPGGLGLDETRWNVGECECGRQVQAAAAQTSAAPPQDCVSVLP